eukprot:TRINITY_DN2672_c0_g1_i1.p1 TRINITY_DN2672_c0_g1~~TRINITY_DN2672_c0_g1_i1.p1  ORF type:complete len:170 (+),score=19.56 TRINITY_DN2672_c0_g1_i1:431-940(+)
MKTLSAIALLAVCLSAVVVNCEVVSQTQTCTTIDITTPTGINSCSTSCICDYITCPCVTGAGVINSTLAAVCFPHNGTAAFTYCNATVYGQTCPSGTTLSPQLTHTTTNPACNTVAAATTTKVSGGLIAGVVILVVVLVAVVGVLIWKKDAIFKPKGRAVGSSAPLTSG